MAKPNPCAAASGAKPCHNAPGQKTHSAHVGKPSKPGHLGGVRRTVRLGLAASLLGAMPLAFAASFPCEKASTPIEKALCASPELSALDEYVGRYYAAARQELKHADACLVADQRTWLRSTRDVCGPDAACLKRVYLDRLATLDAVQPGVTRLRRVALPEVPALLWVLPPAADQVAAPRNRAVRPLSARGTLLNEVNNGDGFVLKTAGSARHIVLPLMLLDSPSTEALTELARTPGSHYEVRGLTDATTKPAMATSGVDFSSGHCTWVYRSSGG